MVSGRQNTHSDDTHTHTHTNTRAPFSAHLVENEIPLKKKMMMKKKTTAMWPFKRFCQLWGEGGSFHLFVIRDQVLFFLKKMDFFSVKTENGLIDATDERVDGRAAELSPRGRDGREGWGGAGGGC